MSDARGTGGTRGTRGALVGAAFLMATSAVGPGFLTQTAVFTERLGASFGFAILCSVLLDLAAQLTVWRTLVVAGRPAPPVADAVRPGLGLALTACVAFGGLAFNVGNVAGAGLGLEALLAVPAPVGATLSAALAVALFLVPAAGRAMDRFAALLGFVMLALLAYVLARAAPPLGEAVVRTVAPTRIDPLAIVTIVGGTVGGYITFAGAHRLLDAGLRGVDAVPAATRSATSGILLASAVRVGLYLAALGVVTRGAVLGAENPPAAVFRAAAGEPGVRLFGLLMWAAAITSVVGSAYTTVSFLRAVSPAVERRWRVAIVAFIVASAAIFLTVGRPVRVLVLAGAVNGCVLPVALATMLLAARRPAVVGAYRHPAWLQAGAAATTLVMTGLVAWTVWGLLAG
ncbi:NRAMP family divalent metal transporter [Roseisolibacter sp. H3M3-2]|uniref:NRAMP family divalent metal transporter n=1 Tax=Roseisolibacter sp. H3M3-2 TaxID=3031323 RepID=UPI0023DBEAF3|nr:NRAMP family divalent metal transporter [Roseisolibacter sp. H3M3-2]MDF1504053.1 divalent metal cation transporter [Roseisolibacter sp. H3M3-2]